ncbi:PD-(D/E)XK motif protein [Microvirga sp. CF3062]|uniref:PD-(D/E)XK motif protein n=1 Tax=Microvirga sp. CF3062 TaxID=3110182 RepID=UPI002E79CD28|nr:PD-(D/E)XK motif protein [Microvirga sp. CF3062]MEE1656758.1 PD-(D/E)XK motif protein [Microvirga sp. CF3062]
MAPQSRGEDLGAAWRALAGGGTGDGWRTIPLASLGRAKLLAARRFPANEEAILVGFDTVRIPPMEQLPQGRGFAVEPVKFSSSGMTGNWISLSRRGAASLDLFTMMVEDIAGLLAANAGQNDERLLQILLARIRAWQDFMQRGGAELLSSEAETGLCGELVALLELLKAGLSPNAVVEAWQGPLDGVQDFYLGAGAIEVKSTVAQTGFPAGISSLEQLDDAFRQPLFLAGVRLSLQGSGATLPDYVSRVRSELCGEIAAADSFTIRLMRAGYADSFADRYTRRFAVADVLLFPVSGAFPRLTRSSTAAEIRRAHYDLDLDLLRIERVTFGQALTQLGVI